MIADLIDGKGRNYTITHYKLNEVLEGSTYTGLDKLFRKHGVRPDGFFRNFTLNQVNEVISKELQGMSYQDRLKQLAKPGAQNINPPEAAPKFASLAQKTAQKTAQHLVAAAETPKLGGLKTKTLLPPKPAPEPEAEPEAEEDGWEPELDGAEEPEDEEDGSVQEEKPEPQPAKRRGRPVGSKNRPKAEEKAPEPRDTFIDELSEKPIDKVPVSGLDVAISMVRALLPQGCSITITGG